MPATGQRAPSGAGCLPTHPGAGTGRWHPHQLCHAPVAREGPARLNINPGRWPGLPAAQPQHPRNSCNEGAPGRLPAPGRSIVGGTARKELWGGAGRHHQAGHGAGQTEGAALGTGRGWAAAGVMGTAGPAPAAAASPGSRQPLGMGCAHSLSPWLAETLVTSGHQDRGTSPTPSTLRGRPGREQRGKRQGLHPFYGAAAVQAVPAFSSSSSSTASSPSGGHTPLKFRVQRWHGLAGCQGMARHGMACHGTAWRLGYQEQRAAGIWVVGSAWCPFPRTWGSFSQPLD